MNASRTAARIYALLWLATLFAALVIASAPGLAQTVRRALELEFEAQDGSLATLLSIALHNAVVCGFPVALRSLGLAARTITRRVFGVIVAASLAANASLVGAALGAYGLRLCPFLVHLPVEFAALGIGGASWFAPSSAARRLRMMLALTAAVAAAAVLEVYVSR